MRKVILVLVVVFALFLPVFANAAESVFKVGLGRYNINGLVREDAAPYIKDNRTYLPLRYVAYACGIGDNSITWDNESRTAYLAKSGEIMSVKVGEKTILVGGRKVTTDAPAELLQDRVMLPLRAVAEALDCQVKWDEATQRVFVIVPD